MDKFESISCVEAITRLVTHRSVIGDPIHHFELMDVMSAIFGEDETFESLEFLKKIRKIVLHDDHYIPTN